MERSLAVEDLREACANLRDALAEAFHIHQLLDWIGRGLEKLDRALSTRRW